MHTNAFTGLSELRALSLSRNELAELPESVFSDLSSLENLWLYRNRLTDLPAGLFSGLSALRTLSLSGNHLDSLPDGLFSDLVALEQLWLLDNQIAENFGPDVHWAIQRQVLELERQRTDGVAGSRLRRTPGPGSPVAVRQRHRRD